MSAPTARIRIIKREERQAAQTGTFAKKNQTKGKADSVRELTAGVSSWVSEFRHRQSSAPAPQYAFALLFR